MKRIFVLVLSVVFASPSFGQDLDEVALDRLRNGGDNFSEVARNYIFSNTEILPEVIDFFVSSASDLNGDDRVLQQDLVYIGWNAISSLQTSVTLNADEKKDLFRQISNTFLVVSPEAGTLFSNAIELKYLQKDALEILQAHSSTEASLALLEQVKFATFLNDAFFANELPRQALSDIWEFQLKMRTESINHVFEKSSEPIIWHAAKLSPPDNSGLRDDIAFPGILSQNGASVQRSIVEPFATIFRDTFTSFSRIGFVGADDRETNSTARIQALKSVLLDRKVVLPSQDLIGSETLTPMNWKVQASSRLGRCNPVNGLNFETTGTSGSDFGGNCRYSGGDSHSTEAYGAISLGSELDDVNNSSPNARGVYWGIAASYLRGGHADRGDEDQTAGINYDIQGKATIPSCSDLSECSPFIYVTNREAPRYFTGYGRSRPSKTNETIFVNDAVLPAEGLLVDRTTKPVTVEIRMKRSVEHIGWCCEEPKGQVGVAAIVDFFLPQESHLFSTSGFGNPETPSVPSPVPSFPPTATETISGIASALKPILGEYEFIKNDNQRTLALLGSFQKAGRISIDFNDHLGDSSSSVIAILILLHDLKDRRPDQLGPNEWKLVELLQAKLSNVLRDNYKSAFEQSLVNDTNILNQMNSPLIWNAISNLRNLALSGAASNATLVSEIEALLQHISQAETGEKIADEISRRLDQIVENEEESRIELVTSTNQISNYLLSFTDSLAREIEVRQAILAQFVE